MFQTCTAPLLAQMVCSKVRGAEVMVRHGQTRSDRGSRQENATCDQTRFDSGYTCISGSHFTYIFNTIHTTTLLWYSILGRVLAFQKENHLLLESFCEELQKNATFCLLPGSALFYLLKYSTFHLSSYQHLNPFPYVRDYCSTLEKVSVLDCQLQTSAASRKRLNSVPKCIMTGCPHSYILDAPHDFHGCPTQTDHNLRSHSRISMSCMKMGLIGICVPAHTVFLQMKKEKTQCSHKVSSC